MMNGRPVLASTGLALGDLAALVALRPDLGALAGDVSAPHAWVATAGPDGAAITLSCAGLWCVAAWLGVGLLAAAATQLPGSIGRMARSASRAMLPAALYRLVAAAAGLGILVAPVVAAARAASAPAIPAPTWPTTTPRPTVRPPQPARPTRGSSQGRGVVVRPGDSLWAIAATRLGPQATPALVAATWPRWYAANRAVIGADPDLIRPGQLLQPAASTQGPQ